MTERNYGQYCGLAYALDLVGERWALLIVRDLIVGPKRFTDLQRGLPRTPSNVLSARLKELEQKGVVRRRVLPRPATAIVYELTEYGQELEDIVVRLGLWGARSLGEPRPGDIVTPASLVIALRASFQPQAARKLRASYELRVGDIVVHAQLDGGALEVAEGSLPGADLVIEAGHALTALLTGDLTPEEAVERAGVQVTGDRELLDRFVELFHLPPPVAAGASSGS